MTLHIVGINHFDPSCRLRLSEWFRQCVKQGLRTPCFVATEWDHDTFERVKAQRQDFRQTMRNEWPQMSEALLEKLALSLGYEGDAHAPYYPEAEVLWLDEGRHADEGDLENYARDRFNMYKRFRNGEPEGADDDSILRRMREAAIGEAEPQSQQGNERDQIVAAQILFRVEKNNCNWAAIIVGKNHAGDFEGSMRRLLERKAHPCEVVLL